MFVVLCYLLLFRAFAQISVYQCIVLYICIYVCIVKKHTNSKYHKPSIVLPPAPCTYINAHTDTNQCWRSVEEGNWNTVANCMESATLAGFMNGYSNFSITNNSSRLQLIALQAARISVAWFIYLLLVFFFFKWPRCANESIAMQRLIDICIRFVVCRSLLARVLNATIKCC